MSFSNKPDAGHAMSGPITKQSADAWIARQNGAMSTTETKIGHTWATQHTAGHETHGQTAIYDESTGKDVAIVYDGDADAQIIAAAPDLLNVCELSKDILADIYRIWSEQMEGTGAEGMIREHLELLAVTIAKAKGGA